MRACVGVTDHSWYEFLAARPDLTEANFWLPSGRNQNYRVIAPGEPFLFKTHHPHNRLVGGGFLSDYRRLPMSVAWQAFGQQNGAGSLGEMRRAIARYRKAALAPDDDPLIGCVMLRDVSFLPPNEQLPAPADFAKNVVRWKGYELGGEPESPVEQLFARMLDAYPPATDVDGLRHAGDMFGPPRPVAPRLGQSAFAAVVQDAYRMRCAVTDAKIRPALQAAHIVPVSARGENRVDNGLLLRADVHIMYDQGYLGVHPERRTLQVSGQLKSVFGNGEEFYALRDAPISVPERIVDRPARDALSWHMDSVFRR